MMLRKALKIQYSEKKVCIAPDMVVYEEVACDLLGDIESTGLKFREGWGVRN